MTNGDLRNAILFIMIPVLVAITAHLLQACSDDKPAPTLAGLCVEEVETICSKKFECYLESDGTALGYPSEEACVRGAASEKDCDGLESCGDVGVYEACVAETRALECAEFTEAMMYGYPCLSVCGGP